MTDRMLDACRRGDMSYFTHRRLNPNTTLNSKLQCPLHIAVMYGHVNLVKYLLSQDDIDVNIKDSNDLTPLLLAAAESRNDIIRLLLADSRVDRQAKWKNNDLIVILRSNNNLVMLDYLQQHKMVDSEQIINKCLDIASVTCNLLMCEFLLSLALNDKVPMEDRRIKNFLHTLLTAAVSVKADLVDNDPQVSQRHRIFDKLLRWIIVGSLNRLDSERKFGLLLIELCNEKLKGKEDRRHIQCALLKQTLIAIYDQPDINPPPSLSACHPMLSTVIGDYLNQDNIVLAGWRYELNHIMKSAARLLVLCNYIKFHGGSAGSNDDDSGSDNARRFLNIVNKLDDDDAVQYLLLRVCTALSLGVENISMLSNTTNKQDYIPSTYIRLATEELQQQLWE